MDRGNRRHMQAVNSQHRFHFSLTWNGLDRTRLGKPRLCPKYFLKPIIIIIINYYYYYYYYYNYSNSNSNGSHVCRQHCALIEHFCFKFTMAILAAIFAAISRRFQIARVNYWRFRNDSLHGRFQIALEIVAAKIASVNGL